MQLVADVSIPQQVSKMEYLIDREELLRLKEEKLITPLLFVYLAIKLTYTTTNPSIDIPSFCEQWEITEPAFMSASPNGQAEGIAQLHKKGVLQPQHRKLQLELF